jgi:hypothetical protein
MASGGRRRSKDGQAKRKQPDKETVDEAVAVPESSNTKSQHKSVDDERNEGEKDETSASVSVSTAVSTAKKSATKAHSKEVGNGLTELIPGYVAPLALDTSSLDTYKVGLDELRKRAERTDASTKSFVLPQSTTKSTTTTTNFMPTNYAAYSFKLGKKRAPDLSAGRGWFGMMSCEVTDQVKTDMQVIRNRTYLDPKRFYKKADKFGKHVQVGTVIEGAAEYYSSRLTNKERRSNLTQEIMADPDSSSYAKRKFTKIQHERQAATEYHHKHKRKVNKKARRGF